jgi:hypothetical protein
MFSGSSRAKSDSVAGVALLSLTILLQQSGLRPALAGLELKPCLVKMQSPTFGTELKPDPLLAQLR